jgi:predicted transcriptional regulator
MTLSQIAKTLSLDALTPEIGAGGEVARAHASDLLSDVLANAPAGGLLLTIQVHMNVVAVALHAGLSAVVFTSGMRPDEAVKAKAAEEKLPLFSTKESTFDAAGMLYALGIRGGSAGRGGGCADDATGGDRGRAHG